MRRFGRIAPALAVLAAAGCGFQDMAAATGQVGAAVDAQFQLLGDPAGWAASYETALTAECRQVAAKPAFEQLGRTFYEKLGKYTSKSMKGFKVNSHNGAVSAQVTYEAQFEKAAGIITATLRKLDGRWLFQSLHVNSPALTTAPEVACAGCGKNRPADAAFCPACGKKVEPATPAAR